MSNKELKRGLDQIRLEALSAIFLHQKRATSLSKKNLIIEFLAIAVPSFYIVPRFILKGTEYENFVELLWLILAACLLLIVTFKLVFKWKDKEIKHNTMIYRNTDIAREAYNLASGKSIDEGIYRQFQKRIQENDTYDANLLAGTSTTEDQEAFRYALKQLIPGGLMLCPKCNADPWIFKKGECQMCGNMPVKK